MLTWSLLALAGVLVLVAGMTVVGCFLPRGHLASRTLSLKQSRDSVLTAIRDLEGSPEWWKLIRSVERLPDADGSPRYRLTYHDGNRFQIRVSDGPEPGSVVWTIADEKKLFEGSWSFDVAPSGNGCRVTLTERGEIANPFIRCMARMMMRPTRYIDIYLNALADRFSEPVVLA
jgi:hypothetical protein